MIVVCPHCRATVLSGADRVCPSCQLVIPVADAASSQPLKEAPYVEEGFVVPPDSSEKTHGMGEVAPAEQLGDSASDGDLVARSLPDPTLFQAIGYVVGLMISAGLLAGLACGAFALLTGSHSVDHVVVVAGIVNSLFFGLVAWSALQPHASEYLGFRSASWTHLAIACLLPLPLQLLLLSTEHVVLQNWPASPVLRSAVGELSPLRAVAQVRTVQSLREYVADFYGRLARQPWWLVLFVGCILPAVCEEMFFRGYLGRGLLAHLGLLGGVLATSVLFGLVHLEPLQMVYTAVLGVVLHALYLGSRSIWPAMVMHFVNNVLAFGRMKLMLASQLPYEPDGTHAIPWYVALTSGVLVSCWLWLLFQTRATWRNAVGEVVALPYVAVEAPAFVSSQRQYASPTVAAKLSCGASVAMLVGAILFGGYRHWDALLAWQRLHEGAAAIDREDYAKAREFYNQAIKLDPMRAEGHYGRATAELMLGNHEQAISDAQVALDLKPDSGTALAVRASARRQIGELETAFMDARKACELEPDDYWPHIVFAECAQAIGQYELALQEAGRAQQLQPAMDYIYFWRARLLSTCPDVRLRNPWEAEQLLRRNKERLENSPLYYLDCLSRALAAQGDFNAAIALLRQCREHVTGLDAQRLDFDISHLERVGDTILALRKAWKTNWVDDVIVHVPARKLWIVMPKSELESYRDRPVGLPQYAGWSSEVIEESDFRKRADEASRTFQTRLQVDPSLGDALAWGAALTCEELAASDPQVLASVLGPGVDRPAAARLIEAAGKQR